MVEYIKYDSACKFDLVTLKVVIDPSIDNTNAICEYLIAFINYKNHFRVNNEPIFYYFTLKGWYVLAYCVRLTHVLTFEYTHKFRNGIDEISNHWKKLRISYITTAIRTPRESKNIGQISSSQKYTVMLQYIIASAEPHTEKSSINTYSDHIQVKLI